MGDGRQLLVYPPGLLPGSAYGFACSTPDGGRAQLTVTTASFPSAGKVEVTIGGSAITTAAAASGAVVAGETVVTLLASQGFAPPNAGDVVGRCRSTLCNPC